jgi:uncharacterized membrane protein YdjX (TVP38/TMEM64 family)
MMSADEEPSRPPVALQALLVAGVAAWTTLGPLAGGALLLAAAAGADGLPVAVQGALPWIVIPLLGGLLVGAALLPSFLLAGVAGYVAGAWGYPLASLGIVVALIAGIGLARRITAGAVDGLLLRRPAWRDEFHRVQAARGRGLLLLVLVGRLSPHMPFAATNLLLGQLRAHLGWLVGVSWLGMMPRTWLAVGVGQSIDRLAQISAARADLPWAGLFTVALAGVALLWACRWLVARLRTRAEAQPGTPP